jgi:hypothetical protein
MRVFFSPRTWLGVGCVCLATLPMSGCKSYGPSPGMGWLSWFSPRPTATALSSTPPTKPSVATLPNPGATTGAASAAVPTSLASYPGAGATAGGSQPAASGYYTGPYGTAGQSSAAIPGTAAGGLAHTGVSPYGAANTAAQPAQLPAYSGYQSPYASTAGGAARTADSRSAYGNAYDVTPKANPYVAQSAQLGGGHTHASASGGVPTGYAEPAAAASAGNWVPPANGASQNWTPPAGHPATSIPNAAANAYRPGSTSRNAAALPASPATLAPAPTSATTSPAYPATLYPSTGLPNIGEPSANSSSGPGATQYR